MDDDPGGRGRAGSPHRSTSWTHSSVPTVRAAQLLEAASDDPYGLIIRLLPAWAMPYSAVERALRTLETVVRAVRRRRAPLETLMKTIDLIASTASLRSDILRMFERASRAKPSSAPDWTVLRARLPEVAGRYTRLRRSGRLLVGRCPLHNDTRPSFTVYPNGTFFCFGCGQAGNAAHLLARIEGISIGKALSQLLPRGKR